MSPGLLSNNSSTPSSPGSAHLISSLSHQITDSFRNLHLRHRLPSKCDVCIVGAGPAGLMLACNLARLGIDVLIMDEKAEATCTGRADGLQPKTIETLRQMRLADPLLQAGVKVFDISYWRSTSAEPLDRLSREMHFPPIIDLLDPYILLAHQGMVEEAFVRDLESRGTHVHRNVTFESCQQISTKSNHNSVHINCSSAGEMHTIATQYLIGCDGVHSKVKDCIPNLESSSYGLPTCWAVLDGELDTDFPDKHTKTLISSQEHGSLLLVPRERNLTRIYIQLPCDTITSSTSRDEFGQTFVMERAAQIIAPYQLRWRSIEWFDHYHAKQHISSHFCDDSSSIFLVGDAGHTHSPKSGQGMNGAMQDSWNLAWKLNLVIRGLANPSLLDTYEAERREVALNLAQFEAEQPRTIRNGNSAALAENFLRNLKFVAGLGAEYASSALTRPSHCRHTSSIPYINCARAGTILPPAKVMRYLDSNPVDAQLDIPMLGQFRIYVLAHDVYRAQHFLHSFGQSLSNTNSCITHIAAASNTSYARYPLTSAPGDVHCCSDKYLSLNKLMTYSLITTMDKSEFELSDLPPFLQASPWTIYLDNIPFQDTRRSRCTEKWLGQLLPEEVAILNVRPDGYVGAVGQWDTTDMAAGIDAAEWLDDYYKAFVNVDSI